MNSLFALYFWIAVVSGQQSIDKDQLLNWCLDGKHHKELPGPEDYLHKECEPWKNHSCCTGNTSVSIHSNSLYALDFDHCTTYTKRVMSEKCRRHFFQDICFYECEPNVGPWVQKVNRSISKERFFQVPLCQSDCNSWWEACKQEFTCTSNWPRNLRVKNGATHCPPNSACQSYEKMFQNASNFCETVWDYSWKVVPDTDACMRLWFSGENPNRKVAEIYVEKLLRNYKLNTNAAPTSVFVSGHSLWLAAVLWLLYNKIGIPF